LNILPTTETIMQSISKAIAGAAGGATLVAGITGALAIAGALPPDTPWWGVLLGMALGGAITFAFVYYAPANKPS
jgi:hypothetical protein